MTRLPGPFFQKFLTPDLYFVSRPDWTHEENKELVRLRPVSSEISDLLLFVSYFASKNKKIKFGNYFFDMCCVN